MGSEIEYKKRLRIIREIVEGLRGDIEAAIVGGSVGYHNVIAISDIDLVIVVNKNKISDLISRPYFNNKISGKVLDLFKKGGINMFWFSKKVDNVEVNTFIYNKKGFVDYCLLRGPRISYIHFNPANIYKGFRFNGEAVGVDRKVKKFEGGYIYTQPALCDGKYYGSVPRDDFFYLSHVPFEKNRFFTNLEKEVWRVVVLRLIKEFGPDVNLREANIPNSIFRYNRDKAANKKLISDTIIKKINNRTKKKITKLGV